MDGMLKALGLKEDEAIVHPWINKALEKAQAKVEARNFDIRKNLLKYDNVMNDQRKAIFEQRRELMTDADLGETIADMRRQVVDDLVAANMPEKSYRRAMGHRGLARADARHLRRRSADLPIGPRKKASTRSSCMSG